MPTECTMGALYPGAARITMNSHHKVTKLIKTFCTLLRFILGRLAVCILSMNFVDDNIMSPCQKDGRHAWHSTGCLPSPKAEFRKPVLMEPIQSPSCAELTGDLSEQSCRRITSPSCRLFPCSYLGCREELKRQKSHRALSCKLRLIYLLTGKSELRSLQTLFTFPARFTGSLSLIQMFQTLMSGGS